MNFTRKDMSPLHNVSVTIRQKRTKNDKVKGLGYILKKQISK